MRTPLRPPSLLVFLSIAAGSGCGVASSRPAADLAAPPDMVFTGTPEVQLPKVALSAAELGLLINLDDPQSVAVGDHYRIARKIPDGNVVKLHLGAALGTTIDSATFTTWKQQIDAALPAAVQALAVSWIKPSVVECMSLTSALAFGFDKKWCNRTGKACGTTADSPYYLSDSLAPFTTDGIRPAMILAGATTEEAIALIDRGVAADGTFPTGVGWMLTTTDVARSSRTPEFLAALDEWSHPEALDLRYLDNSKGAAKDYLSGEKNVLFYLTGLVDVPDIATNQYRPGAVCDHLTSFGGQIPTSGQMSIIKWIGAGCTASFGTVAEPCNYQSKFPDPRALLPFYFRGATLLEAYWKSVAWPGEGLFIGEPLARPWGSKVTFDKGALEIATTVIEPGTSWAVESASSKDGPWAIAAGDLTVEYRQRKVIRVEPPLQPFYRLVQR